MFYLKLAHAIYIMNHLLLYNDDIINTIGRDAGLEMWDDLDPKKQTEEYSNDREKYYYIGKLVKSDGKFPPTLIFKSASHHGYGRSCSVYTINLKTGKPTQKSPIQYHPKKELITKIYKEISPTITLGTIPLTLPV